MSVYEFNIGEIACAVLQEGAAFMSRDSVAARYPKVDPAEIEAALGDNEPDGSLNLFYLNSGGTRILADVGFGEAGAPFMGGALRGLESMGISPGEIDIIYLTHFHGDHVAGLLDKDGELAYPNARYLCTEAEWEEWQRRTAVSEQEAQLELRRRMELLEDKVSFVGEGDEIAQGVTVVDLAGHTLGHAGLLVEAGGERLLHVVDLLHQSFQFAHTDWQFSFDSDGDLATVTRKRVLQRCADENLLTLFYHLTFPGLGHVRQAGDGYSWQPIE